MGEQVHEFELFPVRLGRFSEDDPRLVAVAESPPPGCSMEHRGGVYVLHCRRSARTLLEAVAQVHAEVMVTHGVALDDLGVEKLWEFGLGDVGATILAQLLLMAAERAPLLGYDIEDLVAFIHAVGRPPEADHG